MEDLVSKELWIARHEAVPDKFAEALEDCGLEAAVEVAKSELKELGFDDGEISEQIDALIEESK